MNAEKLKLLQASVRTGGKGSVRRKKKVIIVTPNPTPPPPFVYSIVAKIRIIVDLLNNDIWAPFIITTIFFTIKEIV